MFGSKKYVHFGHCISDNEHFMQDVSSHVLPSCFVLGLVRRWFPPFGQLLRVILKYACLWRRRSKAKCDG